MERPDKTKEAVSFLSETEREEICKTSYFLINIRIHFLLFVGCESVFFICEKQG